VTGAPAAAALDEGRGPEVLQTRSWTGQRLTATLSTCSSVLKKKQNEIFNCFLEIYQK
jgi:hypothetical protein